MGKSQRNIQAQKDRRRMGFCAYLGCPEKSGETYRCPGHAEQHRIGERARYARRKEIGSQPATSTRH